MAWRMERPHVHPSITSIVCLNLHGFSGKGNPWGIPNQNKNLITEYLPFLAHGVKFEFYKGAAECTYMQMDGEPWKQPLPNDDDTVVVEISHHGRVKMLATQNCISRSVYDPSTPHSLNQHESDDDWEDGDATPSGEEWRMLGAADAFLFSLPT